MHACMRVVFSNKLNGVIFHRAKTAWLRRLRSSGHARLCNHLELLDWSSLGIDTSSLGIDWSSLGIKQRMVWRSRNLLFAVIVVPSTGKAAHCGTVLPLGSFSASFRTIPGWTYRLAVLRLCLIALFGCTVRYIRLVAHLGDIRRQLVRLILMWSNPKYKMTMVVPCSWLPFGFYLGVSIGVAIFPWLGLF